MAWEKRVRRILNSRQGRRVVERGRRELGKPENQRRIKRLLRRISGRR